MSPSITFNGPRLIATNERGQRATCGTLVDIAPVGTEDWEPAVVSSAADTGEVNVRLPDGAEVYWYSCQDDLGFQWRLREIEPEQGKCEIIVWGKGPGGETEEVPCSSRAVYRDERGALRCEKCAAADELRALTRLKKF